MPKRIVKTLASAVAHTGWWLAWRIRPGHGSGTRELADVGLAPSEEPQCASSS